MTELTLTIDDLIAYTEWIRQGAKTWFIDHPAALRIAVGANGDGRFATVGDVVRHVFAAERRYVQRLCGAPMTGFDAIPSDDVDVLFAAGNTARGELRHILDTFPSEQWNVPREYVVLHRRITVTPKKIIAHVLLHEIRHWAQIATMCRIDGAVPPFQDFLASPVWGGTSTAI